MADDITAVSTEPALISIIFIDNRQRARLLLLLLLVVMKPAFLEWQSTVSDQLRDVTTSDSDVITSHSGSVTVVMATGVR